MFYTRVLTFFDLLNFYNISNRNLSNDILPTRRVGRDFPSGLKRELGRLGPFQDPWPVERINHVAAEEEGEEEKPKSGRPRGSAVLSTHCRVFFRHVATASAHPV